MDIPKGKQGERRLDKDQDEHSGEIQRSSVSPTTSVSLPASSG
ncbi:MAG: hypothetical protein ACLSFJ_08065 [Holdemania filiformis]